MAASAVACEDGVEGLAAFCAAHGGAPSSAGADGGPYQREGVGVAKVLGEVGRVALQVAAEASGVGHDEITGEAARRDVGEQIPHGSPTAVDRRGVHTGASGDHGDGQLVTALVGHQFLDGPVNGCADAGGATTRAAAGVG